MTLDQFIKQYNLQPADAILLNSGLADLLDEYVIYLGYSFSTHQFLANFQDGARIVSFREFKGTTVNNVTKLIRRFKGNQIQRNAVINRALTRRDINTYYLILNNCEHMGNAHLQSDGLIKPSSFVGVGMAVTGLAVVATSKSDAGKSVGAFMAVLGLISLIADNKD